ncbi:MAG TPA: DUF493 domain-containing protein [Cytophagales bacterium]|nr:DUF493 domain-containing protein [Cytophagales bacterium]HAA23225.1 DUF493 domain-containing protein [Cytophagales bacterium]HAP58487.1 DUF493 domain-containing protein [Cytophagales bacterium]
MNKEFDIVGFKEKLDAVHTWPSVYTFKFIVPQGKLDRVESLFPKHELNLKESSKGKYVSVTAKMMASSSDDVIAIYQEASSIEGIIAL